MRDRMRDRMREREREREREAYFDGGGSLVDACTADGAPGDPSPLRYDELHAPSGSWRRLQHAPMSITNVSKILRAGASRQRGCNECLDVQSEPSTSVPHWPAVMMRKRTTLAVKRAISLLKQTE